MESMEGGSTNMQSSTPNLNSPSPSPSPISSSVQAQTKQSKKRSKVWDHFTAFSNENGEPKSKCNYCSKIFCADTKNNGTSSMNNHLKKCDQYPFNKDLNQKELVFQQTGISDDGVLKGTLNSWKFDQDATRKGLVYMIIVDELPFKFVEGKGFRYFLSIACPHFHVPSRWTITRDCYQLYMDEKIKLKKFIKSSSGRICLTTDTWTSLQKINYLCLTAHFIDNDWKLHKRVLNFCPISSHKGEDIGKVVEKCLLDWGIDKVFTITVDNASSNDTAVAYLRKKFTNWGTTIMEGKYIHVRCLAHIVNLVVQDGLREFNLSVERVRAAVKYIRQSPARLKKFKECAEIEKIESKKMLCLDIPTRWNSTYMMLDTAQKFERAFERFDDQDPYFKLDLGGGNGIPTHDDWDNIRCLVTFLEHFYDFTLKVSSTLYVTANELFEEISDVDAILKQCLASDDIKTCAMALRMKEKYDKYWGNVEKMNMLLFIAAIFDPRHKVEYVQFILCKMYGDEGGLKMFRLVKDATYALYNEYKRLYSPQSTSSTSSSELSGCSSEIEFGSQRKKSKIYKTEYKQLRSISGGKDLKSELDRYLTDDCDSDDESENFDILSWWKVNSHRFPILSMIARDILAIPFSTVASESAFSTGGRVLDAFRSSLTPRLGQALICAQDWLRASSSPMNVEENIEDLEKFENDLLKSSIESTIIDL